MDAQEAIKALAQEYNIEAMDVLAREVGALCETSTIALDTWLGGGEFDATVTLESIAVKWDELAIDRAAPNHFTAW